MPRLPPQSDRGARSTRWTFTHTTHQRCVMAPALPLEPRCSTGIAPQSIALCTSGQPLAASWFKHDLHDPYPQVEEADAEVEQLQAELERLQHENVDLAHRNSILEKFLQV